MKTTKIRKFFVVFTLAYAYLAIFEVIAASKNWDIATDPFKWPFGV